MWWCCGKPNQNAKGCRVSKHIEKEEDKDDDRDLMDINKYYIRCHCCKGFGHELKDCPKDPNLKTSIDTALDERRLQKI